MEDSENDKHPELLGVLGGMGPAATLDFLQKLLKLTKADTDQEQIPTITYNNTKIPDRNESFLNEGESPLPELVRTAKILEDSGASLIVMPCNTAHIWYDEIRDSVGVRVLNMPRVTADSIPEGSKVGILSTTPVKLSGLYSAPLEDKGAEVIHSRDQDEVMDAIYSVKAGDLERAKSAFLSEIHGMQDKGATHILAACTEVPVAVGAEDLSTTFVDPMEVLALECINLLGKEPSADKTF